MRKLFLFLIVLAGLAVIGYFTNPTEAMHKEAAHDKLEKIMENTLSRYGVGKNILSTLGIDAGNNFVGQLIDNHITVDNYYIFSLTRLKWEDKSYVIGVGALNKVFISNKVDDIAHKAADDFLKDKIFDLIPGIENIFK